MLYRCAGVKEGEKQVNNLKRRNGIFITCKRFHYIKVWLTDSVANGMVWKECIKRLSK